MKKNPDCTVGRSAAPLPNASGEPSWLHRWCRGLLPHEWFFTVFHFVVLIGLLGVRPRPWPLIGCFTLYLTLTHLVAAYCEAKPDPSRWRMRLLLYPLISNVIYFQLAAVVAAIPPVLQDQRLQRLDRWLIGGDLSMALERWSHPWLTEILSAAYLSYLPYVAVGVLFYLLDDLTLTVRFYLGVLAAVSLGFLGYMLVPAYGPYLALADQFIVPLSGGWIARLNAEFVRWGSIRIDTFPSLHCALPAFILAFDFLHHRTRFWIGLIPCVLLWFSTVYLRYHYFADAVAGFVLAGASLFLATRWPVAKMPSSRTSLP
jgi:hypothetical protein